MNENEIKKDEYKKKKRERIVVDLYIEKKKKKINFSGRQVTSTSYK